MTARTMQRPNSVTEVLRRDILSQRFSAGDRLQEIALSEHYQCGRATIRAALIELTAEGLVERQANRGAAVRRISIEQAIQITEARSALEGLIAGRAARNATPQGKEQLVQIIEDMRAAVSDDRQQNYSDLNAELHGSLQTMSQHHVATELVTNLRNRAAHHQYRLAAVPGRSAESLAQHAAIVEAVIAGDEAGAQATMKLHLGSVISVLRRWPA